MPNAKYYELLKEFEQIKILNNPLIYITSYCSDLRSEIDLSFAKLKKKVYTENIKALNQNCDQMITRVNIFEKECLNNQTTNKIDDTVQTNGFKRVELIQKKLIELKKVMESISKQKVVDTSTNEAIKKRSELFIDIRHLIYWLRVEMECLLFMNKSIIFLDRNKCLNTKLFDELDKQTAVGKLIIITNVYFSTQSIEILKTPFSTPSFTNESLKVHELKNELETAYKAVQIIEMALNVSNLTKTRLDNNRLEEIDLNIFNGLVNLTYIDLNGNQLTTIHPKIFVTLTNLTELDLSDNYFATIDSSVFNGLESLKEIYLNNNQLVDIDINLFTGLTNLTKINLSHNQLSSLDPKVLDELKNLSDLDLSHNRLKSIDSRLFNKLYSLELINLEHNGLENIDSKQFFGLTNLKRINLNSNQLNTIDVNLFSGLKNTTHIYLHANELSDVNRNKFYKNSIHW